MPSSPSAGPIVRSLVDVALLGGGRDQTGAVLARWFLRLHRAPPFIVAIGVCTWVAGRQPPAARGVGFALTASDARCRGAVMSGPGSGHVLWGALVVELQALLLLRLRVERAELPAAGMTRNRLAPPALLARLA